MLTETMGAEFLLACWHFFYYVWNMKIGLTGTNASGKTSIVKYFVKKGFDYFSLSDAIRDELTTRKLEHSRENLRIVGNELREKFGPAILAQKIIEKLKNPNVVIDSIRNKFEIAELRHINDFYLIALDAPIAIRFNRATSRGRIENATTIEEFQEIENREKSVSQTAQQIDQCMKLADFFIVNDGSLEELYKKIDKIIDNIANR